MRFDFGVAETSKGHAAVLLQEDGAPLMLASKPMDYEYQCMRVSRILNAANHNPLAIRVVFALRRHGVLEPMVQMDVETGARESH